MVSVVMLISRLRGLHPGDAFQILLAGVLAEHGVEHSRRAALHRQMHVIAERRDGVDGVHNVLGEVARMRSGEAHAADSGNLADGRQQFRKDLLVRGIGVGIHVLAEQLNVGVSGIGHAAGFGQHRIRGAAALFAAGVRHHAVGAELVAAFDDGDVSAMRIAAGGELGVEGLVGLAIVEAGDARRARSDLYQHLGQVAVGGRAGDQRDVGRALEDLLAFLLGDAAENGEALALLVQLLEVVEAIERPSAPPYREWSRCCRR